MANGYLLVVVAVLTTVAAQLLYKKFFLTKKPVYIPLSILCFIGVPIVTTLALKELSLDVVYIATSAIIILIMIFSALFFKEKISNNQYASAFLIIAGIIIYNL